MAVEELNVNTPPAGNDRVDEAKLQMLKGNW